jgi:hypothetical protein
VPRGGLCSLLVAQRTRGMLNVNAKEKAHAIPLGHCIETDEEASLALLINVGEVPSMSERNYL